MPRTLPRSITDALAGRDTQPVTTGMSGTHVLRCTAPGAPTLYLKAGAVDTLRACASHSLGDEAARLRWLAAHGVPVPAVHRYERVDDVEFLLLAEVPGVDAATLAERARAAGDDAAAAAVVRATAAALRLLHDTPADDCPFRLTAAERLVEARERVRTGHLLAYDRDFIPEHDGRRPEDVISDVERALPDVEEPALTHGDASLPNIILRPGAGGLALSGFVDCGRAGLADRHQDLALAEWSVAYNLGDAWAPHLLECYGPRDVDERRLRFYGALDDFF